MKRLFISIAGGLVFPWLYFLLVLGVIGLVRSFNGEVRGDSWLFWCLALPIEGGGRLYNFIFPAEIEKQFALIHGPALLADFVASFILFGSITYAALWVWSKRSHP